MEMDAAHELLSAANFLTLQDCVQVVVAKVCDAMTPVRARAPTQLPTRP